MITSILMRRLKTIKHIIDKYTMLFIYFSETYSVDQKITAIIIREVHLINELKANFLIDNDILEFENIDIFNFTESTHIESYDVIISITTKTKIQQFKSIHAIKTCFVSSKSKFLSLTHHIISLSDRDFLFKSN